MTERPNFPSTPSLVDDYGRLVSSICRRMFHEEDAARDAAQEVWLEVLASLPSFRGESKVSTWIYTIARRVVLRRARAERTYSTRVLDGYFSGEENELPCTPDMDREIWVRENCDRCLSGILHCLNNETRLAYLLRDVLEVPYAEIAGVLGKDAAAIRQVVTRARQKLKNFLDGHCMLYNPRGRCSCRLKRIVPQSDLPGEYRAVREKLSSLGRFLRESEDLLGRLNYWAQYLPDHVTKSS